MQTKVLVLSPQNTLREAAQTFLDQRISGAPVVDAEGRIVGVLSLTDLVRRGHEAGPALPTYYREMEEPQPGYHIEEPDFARVAEVMTPAVLSADEDAPIERLVAMMLEHRIHRVIITRKGRLAGIVTTTDIVRALDRLLNERFHNGHRHHPKLAQ